LGVFFFESEMRSEGERGSGERDGEGMGLSQTAEIRPAAVTSQRGCALLAMLFFSAARRGGGHCRRSACLPLVSVPKCLHSHSGSPAWILVLK
jgi:hypothetical protein